MDQDERAKNYLAKAQIADVQVNLCSTAAGRSAWLDVAQQYRHLAVFAASAVGRSVVSTGDTSGSRPRTENRKARRRRILFSGLVFVPATHFTLNCSIKDISETGARIELHAEALLPTRFLLINIKDRIAYEVQWVRRKQRELALKILQPISLTEPSSFEARQLRRLLVEKLNR